MKHNLRLLVLVAGVVAGTAADLTGPQLRVTKRAGQAESSFNLRAHGANGDGTTPDTTTIQKALDECAASGGGTVVFPPGRYLSGTIHLRSKVEFTGGGTAAQAQQLVKGPGVDARSLPAWGLYDRHVQTLTLEDVRFSLASDDFRPVVHADRVGKLTLDHFNFPRFPGVAEALALTNVSREIRIP